MTPWSEAPVDEPEQMRAELEALRSQQHRQEAEWRVQVTADIKELKAQVTNLASEVKGYHQNTCSKVERVELMTEDHKKVLFGGDTPDKGVVVRLDRIEQLAATQTRLLWLFAGALVTIAATVVWQLVSHVVKSGGMP
jgi:hypothetical protein